MEILATSKSHFQMNAYFCLELLEAISLGNFNVRIETRCCLVPMGSSGSRARLQPHRAGGRRLQGKGYVVQNGSLEHFSY